MTSATACFVGTRSMRCGCHASCRPPTPTSPPPPTRPRPPCGRCPPPTRAPPPPRGGPPAPRPSPPRQYARPRKQQRHAGPYLPIIYEACKEQELAYEYRHGVTSYGAFTYSLS